MFRFRKWGLCVPFILWSGVVWGGTPKSSKSKSGTSVKATKAPPRVPGAAKGSKKLGKKPESVKTDSRQVESERAKRRAERRARRRLSSQQARQPNRSDEPLVRGGIYDRPYIYRQGSTIAIGGYVEMLGQYLVEEGVSDGLSFEARRFNLFVFSSISRLIRLTAEIEYEHGSEEIALETALLDVRIHSALNLRGGILLVPIGRFNVAHDAPLYGIIDRPLVSTQIIPATYSDIGFGVFGAFFPGLRHKITYEAYVMNGLTSGILSSPDGVRIANGKSEELFSEDENGSPGMAFRLGYESPIGFDIAASMYAGIYNQFVRDGEEIADPRWLIIFALNAEFSRGPITIRAEFAWAHVELPSNLTDNFSTDQWGLYADVIVRLWQGRLSFMKSAGFYFVGRFDYVDLNMGTRQSTGEAIGDETIRLTVGVSFRPTPQTSIRVVYQHNWILDVFNNPARKAGVQFGMASYF